MSNKQIGRAAKADVSMREVIEAWRTLDLDLDMRKKAFEASIEEDKATLAELDSMVREEMHSKGLASVKLDGVGTAYITRRVTSKVEDTEEFFNFVIESKRTDLLFARAGDKAVAAYIEEEKVPPPGVTIQVKEGLGFRKAS